MIYLTPKTDFTIERENRNYQHTFQIGELLTLLELGRILPNWDIDYTGFLKNNFTIISVSRRQTKKLFGLRILKRNAAVSVKNELITEVTDYLKNR